ncbi:MAG: serine/threonine protein kinase [Gemmataceae bacterium]|nr:serine/threonine protein kinase [Gemmataceae bacterium]
MNGSLSGEPLDTLIEDFILRLREGESPSIEEYSGLFPDREEEVRGLLETAREIEQASGQVAFPVPERLGEYTLGKEIGRGSMGVVYEATQESLGRTVAIKILRPEAPGSSQEAQAPPEAKLLSQLKHPNIVPVIGGGQGENLQYCVMQLAPGLNLSKALKILSHGLSRGQESAGDIIDLFPMKVGKNGRCQPKKEYWNHLAQIGFQAANALHAAHQVGILHCDIKPGNLLVQQDGHVWITDFGLAENRENGASQGGTPGFIAPEVAQGQRNERSDIFSLGATLLAFVKLDCEPGFVPGVPHDLKAIVLKATKGEPALRYDSAKAMADDLQRFLEGKVARARNAGPLLHLALECNRHPIISFMAMALIALAVYPFWFITVSGRDQAGRALAQRQKNSQSFRDSWELVDGFIDRLLPSSSLFPFFVTLEKNYRGFPAHALNRENLLLLQDSARQMDHLALSLDTKGNAAREMARTFTRLGEIQAVMGKYPEALENFRKAVQLTREANRQGTSSLIEVGILKNKLARLNWLSGKTEAGEKLWHEAVAILEKEDTLQAKKELAILFYFQDRQPQRMPPVLVLADAKKPGKAPLFPGKDRHPEPSPALIKGKTILEELYRLHPNDKDIRLLLACYCRDLDPGFSKNGWERCLTLLEQLSIEDPANPFYLHELAKSYFSCQPGHLLNGELSKQDLLALIRKGGQYSEKILQLQPEIPEFRTTRLNGLMALILLLGEEESLEKAACFREAMELAKELPGQAALSKDFLRSLAEFATRLATEGKEKESATVVAQFRLLFSQLKNADRHDLRISLLPFQQQLTQKGMHSLLLFE